MRVVYFDCASGASGDMLLGALVDLGLPVEALAAELQKLGLPGWRLSAHRVDRSGLSCTKVDVHVEDAPHDHHHHRHAHRGLRDILHLLDHSNLDSAVRERSAALFRRLAEAEASVHGTTPEDVHFHEVGAVDSIVDIVGGVIGLHWLKAERFESSPLNVGTGTVTMSHGTFPVPPPATLKLVAGVPVYGAGQGELLTPTGALLVTAYASHYGPLPLLRIEASGHGAGGRDTPGRPNALRLVVGQEGTADGDEVVVLEATIDDLLPQLYGPLCEALFAAGAVDAWLAPVQMKKGRPGVVVTALAPPARRAAVEHAFFVHGSTLGVRGHVVQRATLDRSFETVATPYGNVGVKVGRRGTRVYNAHPEFEDCARAAREHGVPVKEVVLSALAAWRDAAGRGAL